MKCLSLAAIFLLVQSALAIELRVPESWSQGEVPASEVPYQMPPVIRPMIRLTPPTKDGHASIGEMEPLMSLDEAVRRYVRGMPMRGITIESTAIASLDGREGRRIKGHRSLVALDIKLPVEVFLFKTEECIFSVEVYSKNDAASMMNEVLSWVDFQADAAPADKPDDKEPAGRSFWEYAGIGMVLAALAYAIFGSKFSHKERTNQER